MLNLDSFGLSFEARLTKEDDDGANHWYITITRGRQAMYTSYWQGSAYREMRSGKKPRLNNVWDLKHSKPTKPSLEDVMYSLVLDAGCVANGETFEDFCGNLGYDTDSREAERVYNGCKDEYFGLIRLGLDVDALGELFQDY